MFLSEAKLIDQTDSLSIIIMLYALLEKLFNFRVLYDFEVPEFEDISSNAKVRGTIYL